METLGHKVIGSKKNYFHDSQLPRYRKVGGFMSKKQISEKESIINFKSIVAVLLIVVMLVFPAVPIFAASSSSKVTPRQLAIFATLCCIDLEQGKSPYKKPDRPLIDGKIKFEDGLKFKETKMLTDDQLKAMSYDTVIMGVALDEGDDAYYMMFNEMASLSEVKDWKIVNYVKADTIDPLRIDGEFAAMTFKKGNNIVIACRATDFSIR